MYDYWVSKQVQLILFKIFEFGILKNEYENVKSKSWFKKNEKIV